MRINKEAELNDSTQSSTHSQIYLVREDKELLNAGVNVPRK